MENVKIPLMSDILDLINPQNFFRWIFHDNAVHLRHSEIFRSSKNQPKLRSTIYFNAHQEIRVTANVLVVYAKLQPLFLKYSVKSVEIWTHSLTHIRPK